MRSDHRQGLVTLGAFGAAAGAIGTLAFDRFLYRRYRREGGASGFADWETSAGVRSWEDAPAPAKVGKKFLEAVLRRELPAESARPINNVTHWAYGIQAGAVYGVVVGSLFSPKVWYGIPFGAGVWASGYVVLPALGVYRPIWEYDRETLAKDLGAHLVFGLATATAFRVMSIVDNARWK
jgi:hypothetical protein